MTKLTPEELHAQRMKNLKPFVKGDPRIRELQKKGAATRSVNDMERKRIREDLNMLLKLTIKKGECASLDDVLSLEQAKKINVPVQTAINIAMIQRAMLGDVQAAQYIRDTVGEKPSDKVELDQNLTIEAWAKSHDVKL